MTTIIFEGRLIPERLQITLPFKHKVAYDDPRGFKGLFEISIKESEILVHCHVPDDTDVEEAFRNAFARSVQLCTTIADVVTFAKGWALYAVLDAAKVNGEERAVAVAEGRVRPLCTAYSMDAGLEEACEYAIENLSAAFAFNDLANGVRALNYAPVGAGRALDTLRQIVAGKDSDPPKGWTKLREVLNLSIAYTKHVTDASIKPRHGDRSQADGSKDLKVLLRAWKIMDRYLHFVRLGGVAPLPLDKFPVLEHDSP